MRLTPAVLRAVAILDLLAKSDEPLAVSGLARTLDIPRNTAYELVHTLAARDLVRIGDDGKASLSLHLFELGNAYGRSLDLLSEARPIVREVASVCGETTHVAVLDGRHVVYLIKEESNSTVRVLSSVGGRMPAHGTAIGKAVLAFLPEEEASQRLAGAQLEQLTANTVTDRTILMKQFKETRHLGFAMDNGESTPEVCCVGAPVFDRNGDVVAGMSIAVPSFRMTPARRMELAAHVISAAKRLSRRLGDEPGRTLTAVGTVSNQMEVQARG